jgi:hypothetical protein
MTKAKAKDIEEIRRCAVCDKPGNETVLLTIILPPTIMERQDMCPPCLKIAIDQSRNKEKGKASE